MDLNTKYVKLQQDEPPSMHLEILIQTCPSVDDRSLIIHRREAFKNSRRRGWSPTSSAGFCSNSRHFLTVFAGSAAESASLLLGLHRLSMVGHPDRQLKRGGRQRTTQRTDREQSARLLRRCRKKSNVSNRFNRRQFAVTNPI